MTQTDTTTELTNQLGMLPASITAFQDSAVKSCGIQCGDVTDSVGVLSDVDSAQASGASQTRERAAATSVRAIWAGVQVPRGLRSAGVRDVGSAVGVVGVVGVGCIGGVGCVVIGSRPPRGCAAATSARGRRPRR